MRIFDRQLLDELTAAARASERLRKNHNVHESYAEPCQRLFNAVEPGSYIRPHRHLAPAKPETFLSVRGRMAVLIFGDDGTVEGVVILGAGGVQAVDIPAGAWHAIISLEKGSIFFETKPGPYEPISDKDMAPWAPDEAAPEADNYLSKMEDAVFRHIESQRRGFEF